MLKLTDRNWKDFYLKEIFDIYPGKRLTTADMKQGDRPYISATDSNNGISHFVSNNNASKDSNVLGVNYDGSVVETFYHPYECIFSDAVKRFKLKQNANKYVYLFIKNCIISQKNKYTYGYKFNEKRMTKQKVLLPITENENPDWNFMEKFIQERYQSLTEEYTNYILPQISELQTSIITVPSLNRKKWKEFFIKDLFIPRKGRETKMASLPTGILPLISAKNVNNGLKTFCSTSKNKVFSENSITLNIDGDGGVGLAYYQPSQFALDSHCVQLKNREIISKFSMLFTCTSIAMNRKNYGHGYAISESRLKQMRIMLPVTDQQEPDYEYMDNYMKKIMADKLTVFLEYIKATV